MYEKIKKITSFIRSRVGDVSPRVGIVLGSGLGDLADQVEDATVLDYREIDGFPVSAVEGHANRLVFGKLEGVDVVCMQGRFHFYEGYKIEETVIGVRVMGELGVEVLIVSNAAGGLADGLQAGDLMMINDHINTLPNPLIGKNEERWGMRFPSMIGAYDVHLREVAHRCARELGVPLKEGVYWGLTGPTFETIAECKYFKAVGADACGMSTTPEVIVARHMGIKVLGFSVITNADFMSSVVVTHQEVQDAAKKAGEPMGRLIKNVLRELFN